MDTKCVFTCEVANGLCERGYRIIRIKGNRKKPGLQIYVFEKGPGFDAAFTELSQKRRTKNEAAKEERRNSCSKWKEGP